MTGRLGRCEPGSTPGLASGASLPAWPPPTRAASEDMSTRLADALRTNEALWECLHRFPTLTLPAWYLGAGCVTQTIWNLAHGKSPTADILDYDLVYYDRDLSEERERTISGEARELIADLPIELDVTNQARSSLVSGAVWLPNSTLSIDLGRDWNVADDCDSRLCSHER